jgi:phage terminase large subunit-like protein
MLSLIAVFLACFYDWSPYLQLGERGTIAIMAKDRAQCQTIFNYITKLLHGVKMLAPLIGRETVDLIELTNGVNIEIATASYRTIRSRTLIAALCDELAFWSDEGTNPDNAVISAIRPGMGTIPGAMLLCASSPYARRGALWDAYHQDFGKNGSDVLVWQASTKTMNPTFSQRIIDRA